jgi:magnesium-transporting ATPase (P-type)
MKRKREREKTKKVKNNEKEEKTKKVENNEKGEKKQRKYRIMKRKPFFVFSSFSLLSTFFIFYNCTKPFFVFSSFSLFSTFFVFSSFSFFSTFIVFSSFSLFSTFFVFSLPFHYCLLSLFFLFLFIIIYFLGRENKERFGTIIKNKESR